MRHYINVTGISNRIAYRIYAPSQNIVLQIAFLCESRTRVPIASNRLEPVEGWYWLPNRNMSLISPNYSENSGV